MPPPAMPRTISSGGVQRRPRAATPPTKTGPEGKAMSPFMRYGMTALILLYSVYQIANDNPVAGLIGVALGSGFYWFSRKW